MIDSEGLAGAGFSGTSGFENISSILDSTDGLDGGGAAGAGAGLGASTSISNMDRSVPQNPHFFEPGWSGESQIGHNFSPLELGN